MTANEWLGVMKQASDFPEGMEKLIIKYGEMLIAEHESKVILTDKQIEDLFDNDYKDTMFDDEWDECVRINAYKKGFGKAIEIIKK